MNELDAVLRRYPAACQPIHIHALGAAGGMSGAQFWQLTAPRGTLALRRWPVEHPTPEGLQFIHSVLNHADEHGIAILPVPIRTNDGTTIVVHAGHLWELTPWLPGKADYEHSPHVERLQAAMTVLARFHIAVADFPLSPPSASRSTAPALTGRLARLRDLESGGIDRLSRAITETTWPELGPLAREFTAALPHAVPRAIAGLAPLADQQFTLQPCIRDIWHDHVLFTGDRVSGLVDFGAVQVDTPAADIARLAGSFASCHPQLRVDEGYASNDVWSTALAAYTKVRPLSPQEMAAIPALDAAGTILAGCNWVRWIYIDARQFERPGQVARRLRKIIARLESTSS